MRTVVRTTASASKGEMIRVISPGVVQFAWQDEDLFFAKDFTFAKDWVWVWRVDEKDEQLLLPQAEQGLQCLFTLLLCSDTFGMKIKILSEC